MQHDRVTRAYRGLNADQLAALTFHYMTNGNELEAERVASAVPLKDYRCPDVDYQARLESIRHFSTCWTIWYWQLRCAKAEQLGGLLATLRRAQRSTESDEAFIEAQERADDCIEAHERAEKDLLALDAALLAICGEHGIDPADVRRIAEALPFVPRRANVTPDAELQAAMQNGFARIMER